MLAGAAWAAGLLAVPGLAAGLLAVPGLLAVAGLAAVDLLAPADLLAGAAAAAVLDFCAFCLSAVVIGAEPFGLLVELKDLLLAVRFGRPLFTDAN